MGEAPVFIRAADLLAKGLPEHRWAVRDVLPEGVALLVGRPKIGKSWLALNLALAIASGGYALGRIRVEAGDVLYLSLEDNERRLKARLTSILGKDQCPDRLTLSTAWPRLDDRGLQWLDAWQSPVVVDGEALRPAVERAIKCSDGLRSIFGRPALKPAQGGV